MSLDAPLLLVKDRPDRKIALEVHEGLFDLDKLEIVTPQHGGIGLGKVAAQQVTPLPPPDLPQLLAVEGVGEHRAFRVHLDGDQMPSRRCPSAGPRFISMSSRLISMAASSLRRAHSHFSCRGALSA